MNSYTAHSQSHILAHDKITSNARILIVDDDDIIRGLHEAVLSLNGYGTQSAADGDEALVLLATDDFDLLITDCNMPRLDGIGLIRELRAAGSRIPIMMVSGSLANNGELPADVRDEVVVALPKPAKTRDILAGVAHALRPQSATPRLARIGDVFTEHTASPGKARIADIFAAAAA